MAIRFDGRVFDSPGDLYMAGFRAGMQAKKSTCMCDFSKCMWAGKNGSCDAEMRRKAHEMLSMAQSLGIEVDYPEVR